MPEPSRLPERGEGHGLLLRRWTVQDAEILADALEPSLGHLRPWLIWTAEEPLALAQRRERIAAWEQSWREGGDVLMGAFLDGQVIGAGGLHRRIGPAGLEIGYWVRAGFLRRGLATRIASVLTTLGLSVPGITHVEIHHDRANVASAGVPPKVGYTLVAEEADEPQTPSEEGVEWRWRMEGAAWAARNS